jgi:hypothetical protein
MKKFVFLFLISIFSCSFSFSKINESSFDSPFGVNCHHFGKDFEDLYYLVENTNIRWARVDFVWNEIEPQKNFFNFYFYDNLYLEAKEKGVNLLPVLGYTALWASSASENIVEDRHLYPPKNLSDYANFVYQVVNRYKEGIKYWEIWNEENTSVFWKPFPNPKIYAKLLKLSYISAKKADPDCKIVFGGTAGVDLKFIESVIKEIGTNYFDVIAIHPYAPLSYPPEKSGLVENIRKLKALLEKYKCKKPIWITEIGWPTHIGVKYGWIGVSEETQANYLVRSYILSLKEGVEKIFWYDFRNDGEDKTYFEHNQGLLNFDYTPKSSFYAYLTLSGILEKSKFLKDASWSKRYRCYIFKKGDKIIASVWSIFGSGILTYLPTEYSTVISTSINQETQIIPEKIYTFGEDSSHFHFTGRVKIYLSETPQFITGTSQLINNLELAKIENMERRLEDGSKNK